jgi:DNA modification methylase
MNKLFYGDNLDILPGLPAGSVDLVYLDPPFNFEEMERLNAERMG